MFFSYAESAGWLTSSGTMSRTVGSTVVDISCSAEAHDKQELGDDRMKLSGKENLADFSSWCHRCSAHWFHIWVTVSLDHWAIAHLWTPPLFIWPKATGNRIMQGELFTPLYNTIVPRPHYQPNSSVCLMEMRLCAPASLLFPSGEHGSIWYLNGSNCVDLFMLWVFSASQADRQVPGLSAPTRTSSTSSYGTSVLNTFCKWTASLDERAV